MLFLSCCWAAGGGGGPDQHELAKLAQCMLLDITLRIKVQRYLVLQLCHKNCGKWGVPLTMQHAFVPAVSHAMCC